MRLERPSRLTTPKIAPLAVDPAVLKARALFVVVMGTVRLASLVEMQSCAALAEELELPRSFVRPVAEQGD
jgi:hypothetical protein